MSFCDFDNCNSAPSLRSPGTLVPPSSPSGYSPDGDNDDDDNAFNQFRLRSRQGTGWRWPG